MRKIYPDLASLHDIKEPFKSALVILQDLYVEGPDGNPPISENLPLNMAINAAQVIYERVKQEIITYVPILRCEIKNIFDGSNIRRNTFDGFHIPNSRELACIMGCAYYAMVIDGNFNEKQLKNIEQVIVNHNTVKIPPYFKIFKDAADKNKKQELAPKKDIVEKNTTEVLKKIKELTEENERLKKIIEEYTGEKIPSKGKPYFNTKQIAIAAYFIIDKCGFSIYDKSGEWAVLFSRISRRHSQNIRDAFSKIYKHMDTFKNDAAVVADAFDTVCPKIADKIRKSCDIEVTSVDNNHDHKDKL